MNMLPHYPQRRPELLIERAGRETLIYTTGPAGAAGGAVHALNPTAALIWDLCDGAHSLPAIVREVSQKFAVPADRDLAADVSATLGEFQSKGLLLR